VADESERDGYVPNVVCSCGSLLHDGIVVLPLAGASGQGWASAVAAAVTAVGRASLPVALRWRSA
jgi:hypothetical protein